MSGGRAKKRARVEEPEPAAEAAQHGAAASASASPLQAAGALDALPDALLGDVFRALGPRESWPLRGVCRRWRRVVEETEWASFELRFSEACSAACDRVLEAASALFERRRLRLRGGASVAVRPWLSEFCSRAARDGHRRTAAATCSLLAAVARSHGGPAQPGHVVVEFLGSADAGDEVEGFGRDSEFLRLCLLGALRALAPPPGGAPSALQSLSVGVHAEPPSQRPPPLLWPPAAELRAALAPFAQLRSLTLSFRNSAALPAECAAALAAACPLLRSLCARASTSAALAALSPLSRLERLAALHEPADGPVEDGLAALADGPAGRSLRSLAFFDSSVFDGGGAESSFPHPSPDARPALAAALAAPGLAALARMPSLESFSPLRINAYRHDAAQAAGALSSLRGLCEVFLELVGGANAARTAEALRAAAGALSGLPRLVRLQLRLDARAGTPAADVAAFLCGAAARRAVARLELAPAPSWPAPALRAVAEAIEGLPNLASLALAWTCFETSGEEIAAFLGAAGVRRALSALELEAPRRPLSEAEASAIAALPALRRLRLASRLDAPAPASARPFQVEAQFSNGGMDGAAFESAHLAAEGALGLGPGPRGRSRLLPPGPA
eukprot:tig00001177_g7373.t1